MALKALGLPQNINNIVQSSQRQIVSRIGFTAAMNNSWEDGVVAYKNSIVLFSIINKIGKTLAVAPFMVYQIKDQKKHLKIKQWTGANATVESIRAAYRIKQQVYEEDNSHPLNKLIDKPNPWCKGSEFREHASGFKGLNGNRYIHVIRLESGANSGKPYQLELLPPQFVTIIPDGSMLGAAGYKLAIGAYEKIYQPEEIIHSKTFNPEYDFMGTHLYGFSPVVVASKNLIRGEAGIERAIAMLQNAGAAGILYDQEYNDGTIEQNRQMKRDINQEINGLENSGIVAWANKPIGYHDMAKTAVEMEVISMEKFSAEQLCGMYGVPPGLMNPDQMSLNNAREFKKELLTSAVLPVLNDLRDDFNILAAMYDDNIYVDYDLSYYPELQEDIEKVATRHNLQWYLTGNEKRVEVGKDEIDDPLMNIPLVTSGLVPITDLGNTDLAGLMGDNTDTNTQ